MESELAALQRLFDRSWRSLAARGSCDAFGGAEYRRVLAEWIKENRPRAVRRFILYRANTTPEGKP